MPREGQHLEKGLIFKEGEYIMRWLICKKRNNIWRRDIFEEGQYVVRWLICKMTANIWTEG